MRPELCRAAWPVARRAIGAAAALVAVAVLAAIAVQAGDAAAQPSPGSEHEPERRRDTGARPWLGVAMDTDAQGPAATAPGVRVTHVVRRSPADAAGIRQGDRIVRVAGTAVSHGADVVHAVSACAVGDVIDVVLVREGAHEGARAVAAQTVRVTLAAFPSQDGMMRMDLVGAQAPTWRDVEAVSGAFPPSIESMRGRVVLLDFWATWCAPCRIVAPRLGALQARYGAQGLSVVGVSTEDAPEVAAYAQHLPLKYPVAVDRSAETTRAYGVVGLPTLVVIDRHGIVREVSVGYDPGEDARLEALVKALLAETTPATPTSPAN
jgi:thiol-disulfide isomerase/thioredoxin